MSLSPTVTAIVTRMPAEALAGTATMASQATPRENQVSGTSPEEAPHRVETSAAISELVDALKTTTIGLRFEIDEATHRVITKVIDKESGELIRQMPTEEVLRIARAIDKLQGLFINQAA
ncbi:MULTISPECIES: flagellar protein FlaG [Cupriavidus]|uniref:Flagellar protein FlaG n=2 Tax=Cupriavidus TaxID=106589 RepID=A0A375DPV9_9BURK|nr:MULTISPECIES: flagellar protein FlaG [Cupriavidus]PZX33782.1 flagellar protein FlaG [Cupriavidus alkaliphilus]SOY65789.1 Flagellar protein FlaG [Cupriavidus taiwanensis]SOZ08915.1 Flagellar protein FlaG [Cupriavidus taiwanensis]SOZ11210.1 Flagellar protein FlaG [Cupriavidus taiwanensis]SOZ42560.1 Flagellar protein FlaG [Cupriavidus taiwanensis]